MTSPEHEAIKRILRRASEGQAEAVEIRKRTWAERSHREKAEALISKVDPAMVFERDLPKIALAQVHATLALRD